VQTKHVTRFTASVSAARWQVPAALAVVWVTFGGAFVAGKVGVTSVPPFLFAGPRFLIAGTILLGWTALRSGGLSLTRRELLEAAGVGLLTIAGGQSAAMWGMTSMSSGLVAVLTATMPLWLTLLSLLFLRRGIPKLGLLGLAISFVAACLLASPSGSGIKVLPVVIVALGTVAWAGGALLGSQSEVARRPLVLSGLQMLVGGAVQLVMAVALGEPAQLHWSAALTTPVAVAFVFALLGPSLIGFTVYAWLLRNTPPTIANSNAYAAPVVAIFLSWLILSDPVGPRTVGLASMVLAGVALLIWAQGRTHRLAAQAEAARLRELTEAA
jgi:drug/metabolite transporter (DMT)-like permease